MYHACVSQKLGAKVCRNGSIGFAESVKPGGKPTKKHSLEIYNWPAWFTSILFSIVAFLVVSINPLTALVRVFYPEHSGGVNRGILYLHAFIE